MIGDDGEEILVETQQLGLVEIVIDAPAMAAAQGYFDGLEKVRDAGFELFCGEPHLRFGQSVDGGPADQLIQGEGEDGERKQDEQADT
ncbi:MAG: hypothetical protein FD131_2501 [Rhodocyclaceae bacterium]|nr:MAG: hypothetical protein FD131_2501 [Rhodocyclaceae bacterium]